MASAHLTSCSLSDLTLSRDGTPGGLIRQGSMDQPVWKIMTRRRLVIPFTVFVLAGLVFFPGAAPHAAGSTTVTVSNTSVGQVATQISSNNVWSGMIDQSAAAKANFAALAMPLVRLHVGDDGYPVAMPEVKQGSWSFSALDVLVNDVTSTGQEPLMNI